MYKQQKQTKFFFNQDAKNWAARSDFKTNKTFNIIQERNSYVIRQIKKYNLKSLLDVGCGIGDLCYLAAKEIRSSVGIDYASEMIRIAKKKFKKKNLNFINESFFKYEPENKFDCISANGFIEYISLNDIKKFLEQSNNLLNKNGYLVFGTRNRLFNLFSLNKFSTNELRKKSFKNFYEESILLNQLQLNDFIKLKKNKFEEVPFKQPMTNINVDKRHQFSPLQLVDILLKHNFKIIDIHPANYHPVMPSLNFKNKKYKGFAHHVFNLNDKNKLPYIPFSSTFMITAKKA
ncbi:class I SAM-dependent methyltransferase [Pelagibacterales bacterium SAG-MED08]|nr:class I SAM-dependent methyltransferase [Pelagibacterales bacterium SAG-MED08]|tara:strand:+ start:1067 stop:1936 length:870 start_codon:yes stop_codon:yes gene_type:complete